MPLYSFCIDDIAEIYAKQFDIPSSRTIMSYLCKLNHSDEALTLNGIFNYGHKIFACQLAVQNFPCPNNQP